LWIARLFKTGFRAFLCLLLSLPPPLSPETLDICILDLMLASCLDLLVFLKKNCDFTFEALHILITLMLSSHSVARRRDDVIFVAVVVFSLLRLLLGVQTVHPQSAYCTPARATRPSRFIIPGGYRLTLVTVVLVELSKKKFLDLVMVML
jgi:hypothetical protein